MNAGISPSRPKERVYRSSLKNFWILCGIAIPFVAILIYMGSRGLVYFPPEAEDPFRYLAGYAPLAVAAACLMGLLVTFVKNVGRRVGVSPGHFVYTGTGGKPLQIRWEDVLFTGPRPDQKPLFPSALVSDGTTFFRFEKFFFPEFEQICQAIVAAKKAVKREDLVI